MLQKYTPDPTHVMDWGELVVDANGTFEEGPGFATQDCEAGKGVMAAPMSGGTNMGTQGHDACHLSFPI